MIRQEINNTQTDKLPSGANIEWPLVAIASTYAMLRVTGATAGTAITLASGGKSVTITTDANGAANVSLLPFIRAAVFAAGALANPFAFDDTDPDAANMMRGRLWLRITDDSQDPFDILVPYIFGAADPRQEVTDVWWDYDPNDENWGSYESVNQWVNGQPTHFDVNLVNMAQIVGNTTLDFSTPLDSVNYYGDKVVFSSVTYHFRFDRRTQNVMRLRWLDSFGNINERKFTTAGVSATAGMGDAWAHPHDTNVVDRWGYYRGRDQWATIEQSDTITIGDDALPIEMYDSLKTIASAPFVAAKIGGIWQKVVAAATFEADPRKTTFSATITLTVPSPTIQEF